MSDNNISKLVKGQDFNSIKEFIDVFVGIDEQIFQLHQCSSDDFLGLNADFKLYYRQAKAISDNASQIFNALTVAETKGLLKDIEALYKDLKKIQLQFANHLNSTISFLKDIMQLQGKLFLPMKNLNQDLLTLKFLLANLKISNSTQSSPQDVNLEKLLHYYNEVINDFKTCGFQNEGNLEQLKGTVSKTMQIFESISESSLRDLDKILNNIHYGIILFAEKHEEVARQIPELAQKTENSSKSIADIITNLQYHDIIRQKMEHVQAAHKKLLDDLEDIATEQQDEEGKAKQQKLLIRIRDIANLQSAQLVYANKEYQQAVEVITGKFLSISNDMTTIASMCQDINASQENSDEFYLQNLIDKMQNSSIVLNSFVEANNIFTQHIGTLNLQILQTSESITKFSKSLGNLKSVTGQTLKIFAENTQNDQKLAVSLKQVEGLYHDVVRFEGIIQQVFQSIVDAGGELLPDLRHNLLGTANEELFVQAAQSMNGIVNQLNQKHLAVKSLLDQNLIASKNISNDVRESINKIRYYDFFEKVIVDIIAEFNHIYQMLKSEMGLAESTGTADLDTIKDLYTMASERKIHDKVAQTEGDVDLFGDDDEQKSSDDDNFEFF